MVTFYTITLTVACCIAVAMVLGSGRRAGPADAPQASGSWVTPSVLAVLAASSATLSTLAFAMAGANDNLVPLLIGDASMPLAVGLLTAVVRRAAGHTRVFAVPILVISFGVAAVTLLVSIEAGLAAKLFVLAGFSVVTTVASVRGRDRLGLLGTWLVGASMALYATYCVLRLAEPIVVDWALAGTIEPADAALLHSFFTQGAATLVAAVVLTVVAVGVIVMLRQVNGGSRPSTIVTNEALTDWIGALLVERSEVTAITTSVPDLSLHHAAFGRAWAQRIDRAVTAVMQANVPTGSVVGRLAPGVLVALEFGLIVDLDGARSRIHEAYEGMLRRNAPTDPPDLLVERAVFTDTADLRRFARHARTAARRATAMQGM